ncbi:MAG: hypothetical protein V7K21_12730, partial [Nostoc sp.]|uniref:hypothetical protein n=1 Tax=Nostoc sp. TaxID=1180 RepID=UPI002FF4B56E
MDLSNIPKPIWYALTGFLLLTIGYGAATHVPGLNTSDKESAENKSSTVLNSSSVKVSVFDEATQVPIVGAKVIMESEGGSDTDTTDNLGNRSWGSQRLPEKIHIDGRVRGMDVLCLIYG